MTKLWILVMCICTTLTLQAQPEDMGADPATNDVPLDGGLLALAVAGAAYGAHKRKK